MSCSRQAFASYVAVLLTTAHITWRNLWITGNGSSCASKWPEVWRWTTRRCRQRARCWGSPTSRSGRRHAACRTHTVLRQPVALLLYRTERQVQQPAQVQQKQLMDPCLQRQRPSRPQHRRCGVRSSRSRHMPHFGGLSSPQPGWVCTQHSALWMLGPPALVAGTRMASWTSPPVPASTTAWRGTLAAACRLRFSCRQREGEGREWEDGRRGAQSP